jgi:hypothetical protein
MDEMLFDGATADQLAKRAKTTKATVYVHLTHLRKVHKLVVVKKDGVFSMTSITMEKQARNLGK